MTLLEKAHEAGEVLEEHCAHRLSEGGETDSSHQWRVVIPLNRKSTDCVPWWLLKEGFLFLINTITDYKGQKNTETVIRAHTSTDLQSICNAIVIFASKGCISYCSLLFLVMGRRNR